MQTTIESIVISHVGLVRENNEDNFLFYNQLLHETNSKKFKSVKSVTENEHIFAICDGMGAQSSGERASFAAVTALKEMTARLTTDEVSLENRINEFNNYIKDTNNLIYNLPKRKKGEMGTTFVCLEILGSKAVAINFGDSRAYLLRDDELTRLTVDHSEAERLVKAGEISAEESKNHPGKYVLRKFLGMPPNEVGIEGSISQLIDIEEGDIFLLCSDGLTDMIAEDTILKIIKKYPSVENASECLLSEALRKGGKDNVTFILAYVKKVPYAECVQKYSSEKTENKGIMSKVFKYVTRYIGEV